MSASAPWYGRLYLSSRHPLAVGCHVYRWVFVCRYVPLLNRVARHMCACLWWRLIVRSCGLFVSAGNAFNLTILYLGRLLFGVRTIGCTRSRLATDHSMPLRTHTKRTCVDPSIGCDWIRNALWTIVHIRDLASKLAWSISIIKGGSHRHWLVVLVLTRVCEIRCDRRHFGRGVSESSLCSDRSIGPSVGSCSRTLATVGAISTTLA